MRVLFTVNPEKSTFLYLVPMMWALRTAGHEVRVASQPGFAPTITQAGLTAVGVGRDVDKWKEARENPELLEASRAGLPSPWNALDDPGGTTWEQTLAAHVAAVETIHHPDNEPMLADLVGYARSWEPDLVVWEPFCYAGAVAAKACGAAHARMLFGVDVFGLTREFFLRRRGEQPPSRRADPMADWLGGYGETYGFSFSEDMVVGQFTIDQFPASLQTEADLHYVRTQYIAYGGPAVVPRWLWEPTRRPRVGLTLGLTATEVFSGYNIPLSDILGALSELDIEVVATVAESEQAGLGAVPANVRLVSYVPWHALAPTCSAVIHHAGAATMGTTMRHPVPQLALHYHFDQPILGRALAEHGAGLEIHTTRATGTGIRDAVERLLSEPRFAERARDLRDEVLAAPSPNELVGQLEELTTKYRGR
ncbi:activator-dependent family glycosyltransferase [Amycolatopsis suaedae]|uniref:Activator-dependent family glycosyltransferase n=1 Tax=Amycolatopsis suaedae TaxID=2510978 RepID=A0A4Q7J3G0_9PSEU|nr:activator-dependent family glycosyltransferase [Amycolatopsis suaedae]RZQ61166.1 activator-dependent family glycosyltransferase [Amycolatopsis suaedae]